MSKPRLLVLSHVLPFPRSSGQKQRVYHTLMAAREFFHLTFVTFADCEEHESVREELCGICDEVILLPSLYSGNALMKTWRRAAGALYIMRTGMKFSNYVIGRIEFSPERLASSLVLEDFDCVLFEYWHASGSASVFRDKGIPCVLDMHDILWRPYEQRLKAKPGIRGIWKRWAARKYKTAEENAWEEFEGIIAINREEQKCVQEAVCGKAKLFYAPMGLDLSSWPHSWEPAQPPRVAYYGGLATRHNQDGALRCLEHVMPEVWKKFPNAEFWMVGSNPPESFRALQADPRVKVTGYVERVQEVLRTMSVVVCPWIGKYGFRSRLIEVMALGVPVVASTDAVYGMELIDGQGLLLGDRDAELARHASQLLGDSHFANEQSRLARQQVERAFSLDNTYRRLMSDLDGWLRTCAALQIEPDRGPVLTDEVTRLAQSRKKSFQSVQ